MHALQTWPCPRPQPSSTGHRPLEAPNSMPIAKNNPLACSLARSLAQKRSKVRIVQSVKTTHYCPILISSTIVLSRVRAQPPQNTSSGHSNPSLTFFGLPRPFLLFTTSTSAPGKAKLSKLPVAPFGRLGTPSSPGTTTTAALSSGT